MLKINKVYLYKNKVFLFVHDKVKYKGRITYIVSKVKSNGELGAKFKTKFQKGQFKLQKDIRAKVYISMPKAKREQVRYKNLIDDAMKKKLELSKKTHTRAFKVELRKRIAQIAFASIYIYNGEAGRNYNLRDFAKELGFKNYSTLYRWVEIFLKSKFTPIKYSTAIKEATDTTIIANYQQIQHYWDSIYGYNKEINSLLVTNVKAYAREIRLRGLRVN